jgi:hypothetical protein
MVDTVETDVVSYSDSYLAPDTTYFFRVQAYSIVGESDFSNVAEARTPGSPTPPSNLVATTISDTQVDLAWVDNAGNETGFVVERSNDGVNWEQIDSVGTVVTSYSDLGLSPNTIYHYQVQAINDAGPSPYSNVASTRTDGPPLPPTDLNANAVSDTQIDLGWIDNSDNEAGFEIERSLDGSNWMPIDTVGMNTTGYQNSGLEASTTYQYRVRAYNEFGQSPYSNPNDATTDDPPQVVDNVASDETFVAGVVVGSYMDTHTDDSFVETITERHSGGKPDKRYSYLEHKWTVDIQPGNAVTFYVNAWMPTSNDGDNFVFAYSLDDANYIDMVTVTSTGDDDAYLTYSLPSTTSGRVYIRLADTDRTKGNRSEDIVYIDHMFIRSETGTDNPPSASTGLAAYAVSAAQVDLSWIDNSEDESGFQVERSMDGTSWEIVGSVESNFLTFSDVGLEANTTYHYRVRSYNGAGQSDYSDTASATTLQALTFHVGDLDGYSDLVRNKWNAIVAISVHDANENPVTGVTVKGFWSSGATGSGSCITDNFGQCSLINSNLKSNVSSVTFAATDLILDSAVYQPGENHDLEGDSDGTVITVMKP